MGPAVELVTSGELGTEIGELKDKPSLYSIQALEGRQFSVDGSQFAVTLAYVARLCRTR